MFELSIHKYMRIKQESPRLSVSVHGCLFKMFTFHMAFARVFFYQFRKLLHPKCRSKVRRIQCCYFALFLMQIHKTRCEKPEKTAVNCYFYCTSKFLLMIFILSLMEYCSDFSFQLIWANNLDWLEEQRYYNA